MTLLSKYLHCLALSFLLGLLMTSCSQFKPANNDLTVDQGHIIYDVTYPFLDSNDIGLNLLPSEMTLTFRGDQYKAESIGGMGLFAAGFVSNNKDKTMDYFMKVISAKYVSRFTEKGVKRFHNNFPSYRLVDLDTSRVIAGVDCKGTQIIFYNNIVSDYIIWHTDEINIKNFNWCSPFPAVPGVLMEYQLQQEGLVLKMTANRIERDSVGIDHFKIPLDFDIVSNQTLTRKMKEAFMSFDY